MFYRDEFECYSVFISLAASLLGYKPSRERINSSSPQSIHFSLCIILFLLMSFMFKHLAAEFHLEGVLGV